MLPGWLTPRFRDGSQRSATEPLAGYELPDILYQTPPPLP